MIDYKKRSLQKEILDQNNIPFVDIARNMKELDFINTHLGGHSITLKGFKNLLQKRKQISVCEIGCGGGNNLNALNEFCKSNRIDARFIGIDINKECIEFAMKNCKVEKINFLISDYKEENFETEKPDIIFSSLFCHHFTDDELVAMLLWMKNNSRLGFFINDLHRHPLAYHFIKLATKLFSRSYLVKNDAPLSVLRGFTKNEWTHILGRASIQNYTIRWMWAFRYLIINRRCKNKIEQ
ncbi:MAG: methyltransferase domain-containing protein [Ginsengibacter sp.]